MLKKRTIRDWLAGGNRLGRIGRSIQRTGKTLGGWLASGNRLGRIGRALQGSGGMLRDRLAGGNRLGRIGRSIQRTGKTLGDRLAGGNRLGRIGRALQWTGGTIRDRLASRKRLEKVSIFVAVILIFSAWPLLAWLFQNPERRNDYSERLVEVELQKDNDLNAAKIQLDTALSEFYYDEEKNQSAEQRYERALNLEPKIIYNILSAHGCATLGECGVSWSGYSNEEVIEILVAATKATDKIVKAAREYEIAANQTLLDYEMKYFFLKGLDTGFEKWLERDRQEKNKVLIEFEKFEGYSESRKADAIELFKEFVHQYYHQY